MSNRAAKNISYCDFLTSIDEENNRIVSFKLEIPEFQRNYVWKNPQIKELIEAIKNNDPSYYIGNLVIVCSEDGSGGRDSIVDGQQRLVTLSLILSVLVEKTRNQTLIEEIKELLFLQREKRLVFGRSSLEMVFDSILKEIPFTVTGLDDSQEKIHGAYKYIISQLSNYTEAEIETFFTKIKSLEFVVIKCSDDDDAYQLFEGLNSTGLSLSAVELTKNRILGYVKNNNASTLQSVQTKWESIENSFEKENIVWFNKFLRHQWFFEQGYIGNSGLFKAIKNNKITSLDNVVGYVEDLEIDASIYLKFRLSNFNKNDFNPRMHDEAFGKVQKLINLIGLLNLDQIYPVMLALYKQGQFSEEYFIRDRLLKHLKGLWNFVFLVKYSKISPPSYERKFAALCENIGNLPYEDFKIYMQAFFRELQGILSNVNKEGFIKEANDNLINGSGKTGLIKYLLKEYLLRAGNGADNDLETEHIIPRFNYTNWNNITDATLVRSHIEKIGNLTLLNKKLNDDIENKCIEDKVANGYNKSAFISNKNFGTEWMPEFKKTNPIEAVQTRGDKIFEILYDTYIEEIISLTS